MAHKPVQKSAEPTIQEKLEAFSQHYATEIVKNRITTLLYSQSSDNPYKALTNDSFYTDLEMFTARGSVPVIDSLDRTATILGRVCLENTLKTPIYNQEVLRARQNIVKTLKSRDAAQEISAHLETIKECEKQVFWFWEDPTDETKSLYDIVYFNNNFADKILNENEEVLACSAFYTILVSPVTTACGPIMTAAAPVLALKMFGYDKDGASTNLIWALIKTVFRIDVLKNLPPKAMITTLIGMLLWAAFYIYSVYSSYTNAKNTHNIINKLHEKINAVARFTEAIEKIYGLTSKPPLELPLGDCSVEWALAWSRRLFENYKGTVSGDKHLFNNKGTILRTYYQFMNAKHKLVPLFAYVATVDCYLSTAKLVTTNHYCFPAFSTSLTKDQVIKKLWHPALDYSKNVKNNVILSNMLITGPNAAGKSTFIKAVALAVVIGQTLGIAPAVKMSFIPYENIGSYLQIPDCKGRESLFEAEMHRCKDYLDLCDNHRSFIVMDELFSSTNYKEGLSAAYAVCKKFTTNLNTTAIITTHYTPLSKLENDTKDNPAPITNYRFSAVINKQDISYNYKLEKGVSEQYIALDILKREGYNEDILADALDMCERVSLTITEKIISTK